jgi:hypothetical protein
MGWWAILGSNQYPTWIGDTVRHLSICLLTCKNGRQYRGSDADMNGHRCKLDLARKGCAPMANKAAGKRYFGNVRKLPSGRFQGRYTGPDGCTYTARRNTGGPLTFDTRGDAEAWLTLRHSESKLQQNTNNIHCLD